MICPECQQPMEKMCEECGIYLDEPDLVVYDLYNYAPYPARNYRREDHFKEVLNQFQGKEGKELSDELLAHISTEYNKNPQIPIKTVLRKLKLTKFVENERAIEFAVFGKQPPYIPKLVEQKLIRSFRQISRTYDDVNKDNRRSFMNYYYVIFKLLELAGERELMNLVPLLRTPTRIRQHDLLWLQICDALGWTFHPTAVNSARKPNQSKCIAKRQTISK